MEENAKVSVWNKPQSEVTVGESLQVALGVGVVMTLLPIAIVATASGVHKLWEKYQTQKKAKLELVDDEVAS